MKAKVAAALLIAGFGLIVGARFVGNSVSVEEEWSEVQIVEFERIAASAHSARSTRKKLSSREQLKDMQQQLLELKRAAEAKKRLIRRMGFVACAMGIGLALWDRVDRGPE